jgi:acyl carrier protein
MNIVDKIDFILEARMVGHRPPLMAKDPGGVRKTKMEMAAKEMIKDFLHADPDGDIQNRVQDTAAAHGWDAEDFYEITMKVAKRMGAANKI